jgi:hypothetical protein
VLVCYCSFGGYLFCGIDFRKVRLYGLYHDHVENSVDLRTWLSYPPDAVDEFMLHIDVCF